jgi:soluble lytic murein transglycosylase-like protein
MRIQIILRLAGIIAAIFILIPTLFGADFYSYVDENGVRVITNIPPANCGDPSNQPTRNHAPAVSPGTDSDAFSLIIKKYASYYELDPRLIRSIIATESGFDPNAVSSKGARGLMQLMPDTARQLGVKDTEYPGRRATFPLADGYVQQ